MSHKVVIVGAGPIAQEYYKICKDLGVEADVIGRGIASAAQFEKQVGLKPKIGGINCNKEIIRDCSHLIIAVSEDQLDNSIEEAIDLGIKYILVEKPGAANFEKLNSIYSKAAEASAEVYIAYNRRYFSSVIELKKRLAQDGGCESFHFEFTEWAHVIKDLKKNDGVLENWFWHNSSHVVDLAFFLGGAPENMNAISSGGSDWHPAGTNFVGCGISETGALFSYQANWEGPGRWGLEFITKKNRYYLRPMEKLQIQALGTVKVDFLNVDDSLDISWKPGFFLQTKDFLSENKGSLMSLAEQHSKLAIYKQILYGEI